MADINVERKSPSIWPWIIGLLVLALLIWAVAEMVDTGEEPEVAFETEPAEEVQPLEEEPLLNGGMAATPLAQILESPDEWAGQTVDVEGTIQVADVPTDRGFWLTTEQGDRILAVLRDEPQEQPADINPGQTVRLTQARVYTSDRLSEIAGELDADTRAIAEGEDAVLLVDESNIRIVQAGMEGMAETGTDAAATEPTQ